MFLPSTPTVFAGAVVLAEATGLATGITGVLVALIGSAGVVGAALVTNVFNKRRDTQLPTPTTTPVADVAHLYEQIGRLGAQLEDCRAELAEERAKNERHSAR